MCLILTLKGLTDVEKKARDAIPNKKSQNVLIAFFRHLRNYLLKRKQWIYPLISGFALGYAFNTRPMPAVAFGVAGAGLVVYWIVPSHIRIIRGLKQMRKMGMLLSYKDLAHYSIATLMKRIGLCLLSFGFMMIISMAWNTYFTGNPLKFTHNVAQPYDKIGFGNRTEGYEPDLENAFVFTPKWAVERIWRHTIPCISFNTLGWGYYRPNLLRSYHSYTDSIVVGIVAKSPTENNWVTLKLWGHADGTAQIQFQMRGSDSISGLSGSAPGFSCSDGKTDILMRIVKQGDQYIGYFKTKDDKDWLKVGPATIPLKPPFEIGVYAGVNPGSGNMQVKYSSFHVNSDSSGNLISDEFNNSLKSQWKWNREPAQWEITRSGLNITADVNSNLFADDQVSRLYQTTNADNFDIETHFTADWQNQEKLLTLRVIPLAFPLILMLIPLFHPSRNRYDVFFFSFLILNMALYFFFYFEGSTWGVTPVNARYYTECTLLGIIPLVARGMFITYGWIRKIPTKIPVVIVALLLAILTINTVYTYIYIGKPYQNWGAVYQQLPRMVKQQDIHNSVIFVPNTRDAPLSDYPFKSLEDADIVYFRLGPSKVWGLNNSDWKKVYEQYFKGRQAYMYENGKIVPL